MNVLYLIYPLNGLLMIGLAALLGILLTRAFGLSWRLWWTGAATFVLSQMGHIPFNALATQLFSQGILPSPENGARLLFNAVFLGLSAGVWEECARFAVYRWWAKDARSWRQGLLFGAGHGGIEAIIVGVIVLATFVQMVAIKDTDLSTIVPAAQLPAVLQQVEAYWSTPWYMGLLGALERVFAITCHLCFSLLVLQAFIHKNLLWLLAAIGWHAFLDAVAVFSIGTWGMLLTEALVGVIAAISLFLIFWLKRSMPEIAVAPGVLPASDVSPAPPPAFEMPALQETPDDLDQTRYQ